VVHVADLEIYATAASMLGEPFARLACASGSSAQHSVMKQAEIRNISDPTLKPTKTPGFRPKITKMGRCDLSNSTPLKNPRDFEIAGGD
jgi:hypothetical protein